MILTIDIGLRNLAMCVMDHESNIYLWNVYNTLDSPDFFCQALQKNKKICNKKCTFKYNLKNQDIYSCKTHLPKKIKSISLNKKSIDSYLLQDIAKIVLLKIQEIYNEHLNKFDISQILIELQPKINQKMKFTSHIIYGKLVELYCDKKTTVRFVRAATKLKAYTGPYIECKLKGAYAKRKWLSVEYTKWFLKNKPLEWNQHFLKHSKKDDLADCFLMAINGIK